METKQTAVDWLKAKCEDSLNREPNNPSEKEKGYSIALKHFIALIDNEVKSMEKEQIKDAFDYGIGLDGIVDDCNEIFIRYFKENYERTDL